MIQIRTQNRQLDSVDLIRIEEKMRRPLPDVYRAFLLAHNGGRPNPHAIDIPDAHFSPTDVQVFHGVDTKIESSDIFWNLDVLDDCLENHLLPIAVDSVGNVFVLVLDDHDYGQVFYFDAAEIPPRPYFVAKDFNEFLDKIYEYKAPEELDEPLPTSSSNADA